MVSGFFDDRIDDNHGDAIAHQDRGRTALSTEFPERLFVRLIWLCLIVLVVVNVVMVGYAVNRNRTLHDDLITACEHGNDERAALNLLLSQIYPEQAPLPLLDCQQIVH